MVRIRQMLKDQPVIASEPRERSNLDFFAVVIKEDCCRPPEKTIRASFSLATVVEIASPPQERRGSRSNCVKSKA
jgi:hypothetical protein